MTVLLAFLAGALAACCLALLAHPLLRFLKVTEVPGALLACACGRRYRRRLLLVLRSRRGSYLGDIACLPPGLLWIALVWDSWLALARGMLARAVSLPAPQAAALADVERRLARLEARSLPPEKVLVTRQYPIHSPAHLDRARRMAGSAGPRGIGVSFGDVARVIDIASDCAVSAEEAEADKARWARLERDWKDTR